MTAREGDYRVGPPEEWGLLSHSSGQERKVVELEELCRLRREAGNVDGPTQEVLLFRN